MDRDSFQSAHLRKNLLADVIFTILKKTFPFSPPSLVGQTDWYLASLAE